MKPPARATIPTTPGIYFFRKGKEVLYVGKATNLRNRVSSYFQKGANLTPLKARLITEATRVTWEETGSEIEALLAEARNIKHFQPPYNILLRDDKTHLSVVITDEPYPRVLTTRDIEGGGTYYGPFTDARAVKETLRFFRKIFPYRTSCKPESGGLCLDAHLGLCPGVCASRITPQAYRRTIKHIKDFFEGRTKKVVRDLRGELRRLKKRDPSTTGQRALITYRLEHLEKVLEMQKVLSFSEKAEGDVVDLGRALGLPTAPRRIEGYDISNISGTLTTASMVVFTDGHADKNQYRKFKITTVRGANDFQSMQEVLRRRFGKHGANSTAPWLTPDLVLIDGGRPQLSAAMEVWRELSLTIPILALAKRHEEVFRPGELSPLVLPHTAPAIHLLQRVRDEAHRFAVSYHKLLRRKKLVGR